MGAGAVRGRARGGDGVLDDGVAVAEEVVTPVAVRGLDVSGGWGLVRAFLVVLWAGLLEDFGLIVDGRLGGGRCHGA